ncbi:DVU0298 family protein [Desulforhopalus sp. 52FAK]
MSLSRRQVKREIFLLLDTYKPAELEFKLSVYPRIALINALFSALCDANERIKWHAVSSFGLLVPKMADENPESARVIMRRFLWTLNDESGGIGWGAPEAMAQIMCNSDLLRHEYLHMLISYMLEDGDELFQDGNYLELPLLQRGLLWGIGTVCKHYPEEMNARGIVEDIEKYLASSDLEVRHLALWALFHLGHSYSSNDLVLPDLKDGVMKIYMEGEFKEVCLKSIYDGCVVN